VGRQFGLRYGSTETDSEGLTPALVSTEGRQSCVRSGGEQPFCAEKPVQLGRIRDRSIAARVAEKWPPQVLLLTNAEFLDYVLIALGIVVLEVVEQATALAHHHQETAAGGVILFVRLKVVRQFADPFAQHCDLHFRAASIFLVRAVPGNDVLFSLSS
jgi:hypothetical protein